jgi:erythronate-4-phosphate dehydrogenase
VHIVIDSAIPYIRGVFEPWAEVRYRDIIGREEAAEADVLIVRTRTRCNEALLSGSRVRMVASATVGTDHIDTDYCRRAGITVANAPGSNARGVLQWVAGVLADASAACSRRAIILSAPVLGVVGVGHVGSLVAEYARAWGFEVLCCDPPRRRLPGFDFRQFTPNPFVDLAELASRADIITFHTPLTFEGEDATFHLAGEDFFSKVKRGALILNSSRGEVVDTRAAMRSECDFAIDTWEDEPHIDRDFLSRALLATPHIAGYTVQGKANATAAVVHAVAREFGLPLGDWYPREVTPTVPRPISWEELRETITGYFDIAAETRALKSAPSDFEQLRNNYRFRQEYF